MGTRLIIAITVLALLAQGAASAAPPTSPPPATGCVPGVDGCLPTPVQCASGLFNGVWRGAYEGREAVCLGGGGHIVKYVGGDTKIICGAVIEADVLVTGSWRDPNTCTRADSPRVPGPGSRFRRAVSGRGGVVATVSSEASEVGLSILDAGGNAMDAAVAAVFAAGVTRPEWAGIGGNGHLLYRGATGEVAVLDFEASAPAAITPQTLATPGPHHGPGLMPYGTGHKVVGVPGVVAGMDEAITRYGTISLADALAPAVQLAREGFVIPPELADGYGRPTDVLRPVGPSLPYSESAVFPAKSNVARLRMFDAAAQIYLQNGVAPYPPGSRLVQEDYAHSLELIAAQGPRAFYDGPISDLIVSDMDRSRRSPVVPGDEGLITAKDLAAYAAVWREPLRGTYRDTEILTLPAPSGGSIALVEILNILEGFDLTGSGFASADHLHLIAEAQKLAFADVLAYVADPAFVDVPQEALTSKEYAARRRAEIDPSRAKSPGPGLDGGTSASASLTESHNTNHVSVIDAKGNAVSVTWSIGDRFGSAVVAPGTGFLLNNNLGPEAAGTVGEHRGGKRSRTPVTPTIVVRDGRPELVLGGIGGLLIPMGIVQTILNVVDFDMDAAHAVDAPRLQAFSCCTLSLEDWRIPKAVRDELTARGHKLDGEGEYDQRPIVPVAGLDTASGKRFAVSDPRDADGSRADSSRSRRGGAKTTSAMIGAS